MLWAQALTTTAPANGKDKSTRHLSLVFILLQLALYHMRKAQPTALHCLTMQAMTLYLKEPVKSDTRGHSKVWAKTFAPRLVSLRRKSQPWTPPPFKYLVPVTISASVSSCFLSIPNLNCQILRCRCSNTLTPLTLKDGRSINRKKKFCTILRSNIQLAQQASREIRLCN